MTAIVRSLLAKDQTLDGQVLPPWAAQTRGGSTAALVAAVAARQIQMDIVPDDSEGDAAKTALKTTPLTGTTYQIPDNVEMLHVVPAGTIAAHTLNMPVNPYNGQELTMTFDAVITALTMVPGSGKTLKAGKTSAAAQDFATWRYNSSDTTWYRVA